MKRLVSIVLLIGILLSMVVSCTDGGTTGVRSSGPLREIKIAYDPNKAGLFEELVRTYNQQATVKVVGQKMEIPQIIEAVPKGELVGVSPDSSIWLESLDRSWQAEHEGASSVIGTMVRYASTPAVIATWRGREDELGGEGERGWASLLKRTSQDANYRWSHGSPQASASGMLALVAEFYAGANKTYGLTKADADNQNVRDYVTQIEKTISRYGGESDAALVDYLLKQGQNGLSAMVMPEASVFDFNQRSAGDKLDAIQPAEGTLMLDHPLILLETSQLTPDQRRAFLDFGRFLTGADGQSIVVKHGYRPIDLGIDMAQSPLKSEGISTEQPRLLQMPVTGTLTYLQSAWASGLKRRANIMLVADVSGSMDGEKLESAKKALASFVKQIPSDEERVGLTVFSTDYREVVPLGRLGDNRAELLAEIEDLTVEGKTAFFYSVWRAHRVLAQKNDTERINVVVAMTDGQENASSAYSQHYIRGLGNVPRIVDSGTDVGPLVETLKASGPGILVFAVGYGSDADMDGLNKLASNFGGQAYEADPATIAKLYQLISQYF